MIKPLDGLVVVRVVVEGGRAELVVVLKLTSTYLRIALEQLGEAFIFQCSETDNSFGGIKFQPKSERSVRK